MHLCCTSARGNGAEIVVPMIRFICADASRGVCSTNIRFELLFLGMGKAGIYCIALSHSRNGCYIVTQPLTFARQSLALAVAISARVAGDGCSTT